jgi:hypothetical protein
MVYAGVLIMSHIAYYMKGFLKVKHLMNVLSFCLNGPKIPLNDSLSSSHVDNNQNIGVN